MARRRAVPPPPADPLAAPEVAPASTEAAPSPDDVQATLDAVDAEAPPVPPGDQAAVEELTEADRKKAEKKARNVAAREAYTQDMSAIERLVVMGDIGQIAVNPELRLTYVANRCERLGIPPMASAVIFLPTDGKLVPYHTAVCGSAIRSVRRWSSMKLSEEVVDGLYIVWARVYDPKDPTYFAENMGCFPMTDSEGLALTPTERGSNRKKAWTQAERRATFSLAGLGGEDPKEDAGVPGWYPQEGLTGLEGKELKVITPGPRTARAIPAQTTTGAAVEGMEMPTPQAAPAKMPVFRKKGTGAVVPQKGAKAQPPAGGGAVVEETPTPVTATVPPEIAPTASTASPPAAQVVEAEVVQAPATPCTHPSIVNSKSVKPGVTYACPPPPHGCGQEFTMPGVRAEAPKPPAPIATTAGPVRPKAGLTFRKKVL